MVYYVCMSYTVKQLSRLAGVSVRTLHYYDEIKLLKPTSIGTNGYRYYDEEALIRLQQILFYRELDLSLDEICRVLENPDFEVISALKNHKKSIKGRIDRLQNLIKTVDDTIYHLEGLKEMTDKELFKAFTEEEQEKYAVEAEQKYDPEIVRASNRKWKSYTSDKKTRILAEGNQIYIDILAAMPKGSDSAEVQSCVERWRNHMNYFWTPSLEQLIGLAEGYNSDPAFKKNFDKIDPHLTEFMLEAVQNYVKNASKVKP